MADVRVKKLRYMLLAGVLGSFGIHKFYLGNKKPGLVYLLLCWTFIPMLLGILEALAVVFRPKDKDGCIWMSGDSFFDL